MKEMKEVGDDRSLFDRPIDTKDRNVDDDIATAGNPALKPPRRLFAAFVISWMSLHTKGWVWFFSFLFF